MRILARRPALSPPVRPPLHARARVHCRSAELSAPLPLGNTESANPWFLPRGFWQGNPEDLEPAVTLTKLGPEKWELEHSETLVLGPVIDPQVRHMIGPFLKHFDKEALANEAGIKEMNGMWTITVPAGFFFDLGSIPRIARGIIGPQEILRSSMVHDWLYDIINCAKMWDRKAARGAILELKRAADDVLEFALKYENDFHGMSCSRTGDTFHNRRYKDSRLHPEFGISSFQRAVIVQAVRMFGGQSLFVDAEEYDPDGPPCSAREGNTLGFQCKTIVPNLALEM